MSPQQNKTISTKGKQATIIELDDNFWIQQPGFKINLELNQKIIFKGSAIKRFVSISEGFIQTTRIDENTLEMLSIKAGQTFYHLSDSKGKWTFFFEISLPKISGGQAFSLNSTKENAKEILEDPFKVRYSNSWDSPYRGNSIANLERESLSYTQKISVEGPTPYAYFDSFVTLTKFTASTEVTGYGYGFSKINTGPLHDFSIRGYDTGSSFTPLSLPGKSFRGILLEGKNSSKKLRYTYLQGQDFVTFGQSSTNQVEKRQSFIEGLRLTAFPENPFDQFSFNYARGFGEARPVVLKDKVFSIDAHKKIKDWQFDTEHGYDESDLAHTFTANLLNKNSSFNFGYRNIDRLYQSINGSPSGQGEESATFAHSLNLGKSALGTYLNFYHNNYDDVGINSKKINYDFSTNLSMEITESISLNNSLYFNDTPGITPSSRNLRTNNILTKKLRFMKLPISIFIGDTLSRIRTPNNSNGLEYDRTSLITGLRFPFLRDFSYYFTYEYSIISDANTGEHAFPFVKNMGVTFSRALNKYLSFNWTLSYRDEENTDDSISFLSGQDSLDGSASLNYMPFTDTEFFLSTRLRNAWREGRNATAFNDASINFGLTTTWETPFRWNPHGVVMGVVYKDLNQNSKRDIDETGIPNIKINVGNKIIITDKSGYFFTSVFAKQIRVGIDVRTIPSGYILLTQYERDLPIKQGDRKIVNFNLSIQSGLHGVVYFDANKNGKLDLDDTLINDVKVLLDDKLVDVTDGKGGFQFKDIKPGKHLIRFDINTIPLKFIPQIKLKHEIVVEEGKTKLFNFPVILSN